MIQTKNIKKRLSSNGCICPYASTMELKKRIIHMMSGKSSSINKQVKLDITNLIENGNNLIYYIGIPSVFGQKPSELEELREKVCIAGAKLAAEICIKITAKDQEGFPLKIKQSSYRSIQNKDDLMKLFYRDFKNNYTSIAINESLSSSYFTMYMGPIYTSANTGVDIPGNEIKHGRYAPEHIIVCVPLSDFEFTTYDKAKDLIFDNIKHQHHKAGFKSYGHRRAPFFLDPRTIALNETKSNEIDNRDFELRINSLH